ncbi:hypothetical protein C8Q79DRAFT_1001590 [Trametes meyenii]|nr:hypothetical protein C8Q79DRAFT_1001590 [Trametes meyenii]
MPLCDQYLDEILRYEGQRGYDFTKCAMCSVAKGLPQEQPERCMHYRCLECDIIAPHCSACLLSRHQGTNFSRALHRIEQWNGRFFETTSLSELGLVVNLGHDGGCCPDPTPVREVTVFHVNGYHSVNVSACGCLTALSSDSPPLWRQFLRQGWFPATQKRPATAFTIEVLKLFHELNLKAKTNAYDFYQTLLRRTDHSGLASHPFCYVVRLWRHLQQLKRGARGHDPAGTSATAPGSLAVMCPACPNPGVNLPDDWDMAPADEMHCRCKDRGLDDIELAPGWSYYVEEGRFSEYIKGDHSQIESKRNTCSAEHNAILKANLCKKGYVASGVGAVFCARHAFFRPNGVGDLHLREKYAYMDYLLVSTLLGVTLLLLVISYDIACQYSKNFEQRLEQNFSGDMLLDLEDVHLRWVIPKNHIAVHGPHHSRYSLNFINNVGRTYGEGCESAWPDLNQASVSTREMALATRHEVLNDHMASWNWSKVIGLGSRFQKDLMKARRMAEKQRGLFNEFSATFSQDTVKEWTRLVELWCANPTAVPDPFEEPQSNISRDKVRLELAKEDADPAMLQSLPQLDMTPSVFIQVGLELEEQQRVLQSKAKQSNSDKDMADLYELRSTLLHRVSYWAELQNIYMPSVLQLRLDTGTHLPDSLSVDIEADSEAADTGVEAEHTASEPVFRLLGIELRLRLAQASDSLSDIRRVRRMLKGIAEFKKMNISGTGGRAATRSRTLYSKFMRKQERVANRYRAAYGALLSLDPDGAWKCTYHILQNSHLTGPTSDDTSPGEGQREISWIWLVPRDKNTNTNNEGSDDARQYDHSMRAEWAKAKARAERWEEDEELIVEEMRRTLVSLEERATSWEAIIEKWAQLHSTTPTPTDVLDGLRAYAYRQASIQRGLISRFATMWLPQLSKLGIQTKWASNYNSLASAANTHTASAATDDSDDDAKSAFFERTLECKAIF